MTDTTSRSARRRTVARYAPMRWLPNYRRVQLGGDLLAGAFVAGGDLCGSTFVRIGEWFDRHRTQLSWSERPGRVPVPVPRGRSRRPPPVPR